MKPVSAARITAAEYRAMHSREKKQGRVRGTVRTRVGDVWFDSALEAARYAELLLLQKAGAIRDLKTQVNIPLQGHDGPVLTPTGRQMLYVADFQYQDAQTGLTVVEDAKGWRTDTYKMKRAVLAAMGIQIRETKNAKTRRK